MKIAVDTIDVKNHVVADYYVESATTLWEAAWNIAIGQSIGNPNIRSGWETEQLVADHACKIVGDEHVLRATAAGHVRIAFPLRNLNLSEDGVSQLLCHLMGGHLDIDLILKCHLVQLEIGTHPFLGPKFGIQGIRSFTGVYDKPLLGGIVKPKTGISPDQLVKLVEEMVDGGANFIKEDEIMADPAICPLAERVTKIMKMIAGRPVIYAVCITGDSPYINKRARQVADLGGNAVHANIWSGMGTYRVLRELDLPLFLFFQKSGDRIMTDPAHRFHIGWNVVCKLATLMGVDFIHAGMWGGYSHSDDLSSNLALLCSGGVMPSLSCGMHPGLVQACTKQFGIDYMANVGGAIHGHPGGTKAGTLAMRQAIDGCGGIEYDAAIQKWGLHS